MSRKKEDLEFLNIHTVGAFSGYNKYYESHPANGDKYYGFPLPMMLCRPLAVSGD